MSTLSIVPLTHDIDFILAKMAAAGVANHYGYSVKEDGIYLRYRAENFEVTQAVLNAYPTQYADEVLRGRLKVKVTDMRRAKQSLPATFMGMPVPTDDVTIGRITAAAYLMDANPASPQTRRWKVADDLWLTLNREALVGMGTAIAAHIQQCFEQEEALHAALDGAATVDDLRAVDLEAGWPV
ncbi:MAG: DUF4376 domain-containing protein [Sphingomonadales bacterium]|jgi:hypothetical protein